MTCFWCKFGFGKCFGASFQYNLWGGGCHLSYNIHFSLHITVWLRNGSLLLCTIREDDTSEWLFFFFDLQSAHAALTELFHLSSLLQMPNSYRMVDAEFFNNFCCSCKRISFSDPFTCLLSTSDGWSLCFSFSGLSSPLQNFLNHHCTVRSLAVPGPNTWLMLWVFSATLWPILNSNKKAARVCH